MEISYKNCGDCFTEKECSLVTLKKNVDMNIVIKIITKMQQVK